jgi:hypothetical protein
MEWLGEVAYCKATLDPLYLLSRNRLPTSEIRKGAPRKRPSVGLATSLRLHGIWYGHNAAQEWCAQEVENFVRKSSFSSADE